MRIIDATAKKCKIPDERVYKKLEFIGNTCAGTIPVCLSMGYEEGKFRKGDNLLLTAFGGGFAWGANIIKWELS
jgi:3-oxoacyl-[acyl-carrier-protein] synthase-3